MPWRKCLGYSFCKPLPIQCMGYQTFILKSGKNAEYFCPGCTNRVERLNVFSLRSQDTPTWLRDEYRLSRIRTPGENAEYCVPRIHPPSGNEYYCPGSTCLLEEYYSPG